MFTCISRFTSSSVLPIRLEAHEIVMLWVGEGGGGGAACRQFWTSVFVVVWTLIQTAK